MKKLFVLFKANKGYLLYLLKKQKLYIILQIVVILLNIPYTLLNLYAPKEFLDNIVYDGSLKSAMLWIIALIGVQLFVNLSNSLIGKYNEHVKSKAKLKMKIDTYKRYNDIYLSYFEDKEKMDNAKRAFEYTDRGCNAFFDFLIKIFGIVVSLITVSYISLTFDWWLWLLLLLVFAINLIMGSKGKKISYNFNKAQSARNRIIGYYPKVFDNKTTLAETKIYGSENFFLQKYKDSWIKNLIIRIPHNIKMTFFYFVQDLPETLLNLVCYFAIGIKLYNNEATIGDYTLFFAMISQINGILFNIQWSFTNVYDHALTAQNYIDFMEDVSECIHTEKERDNLLPVSGIEMLELRNLTFRYNNQVGVALDNISLSIRRGEKISIVGLNGAGKTTLIKMLLLLYKPSCGGVFINGHPASEVDNKEFWSHTGVVFQNYGTYSVSVADNITFGKEYTCGKLEEIITSVGMKERIEKLHSKLDTMISQSLYSDGIDFSGGEKQRLAIARALVRNADIYIFDEPSSALDAKAEDELYNIINQIPEEKTVIFISHRLASVSSTNRIIVISDGRIIGDGSHKELLTSCPEYKDMYETQAKRYGGSV